MACMALWCGKSWEVSAGKIIGLQNLTTSFKLKTEAYQESEGSPPVNVRGRELVPLSFDVPLHGGAGVDCRQEIEDWKGLVGTAGPFLLAGERFGPERLRLCSVAVNEVKLDDLGRIQFASLGLEFIEDVAAEKRAEATDASASEVGPTPAERDEMKPENEALENAESEGITAGSRVQIVGASYADGEPVPRDELGRTQRVTRVSGQTVQVGSKEVALSDVSLA